MKNNIELKLKDQSGKRMEFFLNHVDEPLVEVPFNWHGLHLSDHIIAGYKFISSGDKPVTITALLCDSYQDANEIARKNSFPVLPTAKWSLNGNFLYVVESADREKVSNILSFFAGKE
ncbi:MAG: hypothetical protein ABI237_12640 [Ginsengibacter sp.]